MANERLRLRHSFTLGFSGKTPLKGATAYARGFRNVELTLEQFIRCVAVKGHSYCVQLKNGVRRKENFLASNIISVDIDGGYTSDRLLARPLVRDNAAVVYTTASHTQEAPRFRIVWVAPSLVETAKDMAALSRALSLRMNGDPAACDAARLFHGNPGAQVWRWGDRTLPIALYEELLAQGHAGQTKDTTHTGRVASNTSTVGIGHQELIKLTDGSLAPLNEITVKAAVHCPRHHDQRASAFVVQSNRGTNGIHCSTCGVTYWSERQPRFNFNSFDEKVHEAVRYYVEHQDPGPLFNRTGKLIGPTQLHVMMANGAATPLVLEPGLTLVKSPKGSGKTEGLRRLLEGKSVLLIGHRRTLIRQSCDRLEISCYLDRRTEKAASEQEIPRPIDPWRIGVCLDSLEIIATGRSYDVLVLDESEQVLSHFLSATLDEPGREKRRVLFRRFTHLVRIAKSVVALDADLGWVSLLTLSRMINSRSGS